MKWSACENLASIRAHTAHRLDLRTSSGIVSCSRPLGGWTTVNITMMGPSAYVQVAGPDSGGAGFLDRASGGVACLTMVTPDSSGAPQFKPIYIHAKMAVVDAEYTLGSSNISVDSFCIDSETNVAVQDRNETTRLMNAFFPVLVGGYVASDLRIWVDRMEQIASANHDMERRLAPWAPKGLLTEFPYG